MTKEIIEVDRFIINCNPTTHHQNAHLTYKKSIESLACEFCPSYNITKLSFKILSNFIFSHYRCSYLLLKRNKHNTKHCPKSYTRSLSEDEDACFPELHIINTQKVHTCKRMVVGLNMLAYNTQIIGNQCDFLTKFCS